MIPLGNESTLTVGCALCELSPPLKNRVSANAAREF